VCVCVCVCWGGGGDILVLGDLEIQRRGAPSDAPGDVVVRAVTRTEPAAEIAGFTDGHAAQMGADAEHDQPLGVLDTVRVGLRVAQRLDLDFVRLLDLVGRAVADEDRLATPFDDQLGERNVS